MICLLRCVTVIAANVKALVMWRYSMLRLPGAAAD